MNTDELNMLTVDDTPEVGAPVLDTKEVDDVTGKNTPEVGGAQQGSTQTKPPVANTAAVTNNAVNTTSNTQDNSLAGATSRTALDRVLDSSREASKFDRNAYAAKYGEEAANKVQEKLDKNVMYHDAVGGVDLKHALHNIVFPDDFDDKGGPGSRSVVKVDTNRLRDQIVKDGTLTQEEKFRFKRVINNIAMLNNRGLRIIKGKGGRYWIEGDNGGKREYALNGIFEIRELLDKYGAVTPGGAGGNNGGAEGTTPGNDGTTPGEDEGTTPDGSKELPEETYEEGFKDYEIAYLTSFGIDGISSIAGLIQKMTGVGYGTGAGTSLIGGIASTAVAAYGDYLNEEVGLWEGIKNAGVRLGLEGIEAFTLAPASMLKYFSKGAKVGQLLRKGIHLGMLAGTIDNTLGTNWLEIMDKAASEDQSLNVDDWRNISAMINTVVGLSASSMNATAAKSKMKKAGARVKDKKGIVKKVVSKKGPATSPKKMKENIKPVANRKARIEVEKKKTKRRANESKVTDKYVEDFKANRDNIKKGRQDVVKDYKANKKSAGKNAGKLVKKVRTQQKDPNSVINKKIARLERTINHHRTGNARKIASRTEINRLKALQKEGLKNTKKLAAKKYSKTVAKEKAAARTKNKQLATKDAIQKQKISAIEDQGLKTAKKKYVKDVKKVKKKVKKLVKKKVKSKFTKQKKGYRKGYEKETEKRKKLVDRVEKQSENQLGKNYTKRLKRQAEERKRIKAKKTPFNEERNNLKTKRDEAAASYTKKKQERDAKLAKIKGDTPISKQKRKAIKKKYETPLKKLKKKRDDSSAVLRDYNKAGLFKKGKRTAKNTTRLVGRKGKAIYKAAERNLDVAQHRVASVGGDRVSQKAALRGLVHSDLVEGRRTKYKSRKDVVKYLVSKEFTEDQLQHYTTDELNRAARALRLKDRKTTPEVVKKSAKQTDKVRSTEKERLKAEHEKERAKIRARKKKLKAKQYKKGGILKFQGGSSIPGLTGVEWLDNIVGAFTTGKTYENWEKSVGVKEEDYKGKSYSQIVKDGLKDKWGIVRSIHAFLKSDVPMFGYSTGEVDENGNKIYKSLDGDDAKFTVGDGNTVHKVSGMEYNDPGAGNNNAGKTLVQKKKIKYDSFNNLLILSGYNSFLDKINKKEKEELANNPSDADIIREKYRKYREDFKEKGKDSPYFIRYIAAAFENIKPSDFMGVSTVDSYKAIIPDINPAVLDTREPTNLPGLTQMINNAMAPAKVNAAGWFEQQAANMAQSNRGQEMVQKILMSNAEHIENQKRNNLFTRNQNIMNATQAENNNIQRRFAAETDYQNDRLTKIAAANTENRRKAGRLFNAATKTGLQFSNMRMRDKVANEYADLAGLYSQFNTEYVPRLKALDPKSEKYNEEVDNIYSDFWNKRGYDARNFTPDLTKLKDEAGRYI